MRFPQISDWRERRRIAYLLYGNDWGDSGHKFVHKQYTDDQQLIDDVVDMFENGSTLTFPAKYVFVNIIYCYFLNKVFGVDFYQALDDRSVLFDSPYPILYHEKREAYDAILAKTLDKIITYDSIKPTVRYFEREFLLDCGECYSTPRSQGCSASN